MAKGQQRPGKQDKKPKAVEAKPKGPKYLREGEGLQPVKLGEQRGGKK